MAFLPTSPLSLDGHRKFLSIMYHRYINTGVFAFAELNIADRLVHADPKCGFTAEEIITNDRLEWNSCVLHRILRLCADVGIVDRVTNGNDYDHFLLTESGKMLTSDHPSHTRDLMLLTLGPFVDKLSSQMPRIVRGEGSDSGVARVSGGIDFYTLYSQDDQKDLLSIFSGAMTAQSLYIGDKLTTGVDFGRFKTLVDFGGNRGTYLAQILQNYPTIERGIVFDLSQVVSEFQNGEEFCSRMVSKDRFEFVAGDMRDSTTIPQADAYVLKHVLHIFDDENAIAVLSAIREANKNRTPPPTVFIVEHIIFTDGAVSNWQSHALDMAMAIFYFGNARERTQMEYEHLLKQSGYRLKQLYALQAPNSIIETVPID